MINGRSVNVNDGLKQISQKYKDFAQALGHSAFADRKKALDAFGKNLESITQGAIGSMFVELDGEPILPNPVPLLSRKRRTRLVTDLYIGIIFPALGTAHYSEMKILATERFTRAALVVSVKLRTFDLAAFVVLDG